MIFPFYHFTEPDIQSGGIAAVIPPVMD